MNPLTHAYFALELFREDNLTQDEIDHLIVGSILPDISITGLIHYQKTHYSGLDFFKFVKNDLHKFLALGIITHGEEPFGLDYYTHYGQGFVQQNHSKVFPLAEKNRKYIGEINNMTVHYLIEFSADNLVAEKDPLISAKVLRAFQNPKIKSAITAFSNLHGFSERKNNKIIALLNNKFLLNYFHNFSSPETTSQNWINLTFYHNLKKGKNLPFKEKVKKLTKFTYYNLKRKISDKNITKLFNEINNQLKEDAHIFLSETKQKITKLKNELLQEIRSQKS